mmetsp:Transcript_89694/g.192238  ORF Transcript_89694/g.192238 Transcript_89694/m.192238 type:complete len:327 (+) Transcript_89694:14-994(+)
MATLPAPYLLIGMAGTLTAKTPLHSGRSWGVGGAPRVHWPVAAPSAAAAPASWHARAAITALTALWSMKRCLQAPFAFKSWIFAHCSCFIVSSSAFFPAKISVMDFEPWAFTLALPFSGELFRPLNSTSRNNWHCFSCSMTMTFFFCTAFCCVISSHEIPALRSSTPATNGFLFLILSRSSSNSRSFFSYAILAISERRAARDSTDSGSWDLGRRGRSLGRLLALNSIVISFSWFSLVASRPCFCSLAVFAAARAVKESCPPAPEGDAPPNAGEVGAVCAREHGEEALPQAASASSASAASNASGRPVVSAAIRRPGEREPRAKLP